MENLIIKKTISSPNVYLSKSENKFSISGRSLVENVHDFFVPIHNWFDLYFKSPCQNTLLELDLEYLNSGSLKQLFRLLYTLEDMNEIGHHTKVIWNYKKGDELMHQKGLEFQRFLSITVDLKEAS